MRRKIETELVVSLWRMKYMNGLRSKLARMLYIENCIIKSRRAVPENRWMKTVHIKVGSSLKKLYIYIYQKKTNPTTDLFHSQPSEESQIRVIVFEGRT